MASQHPHEAAESWEVYVDSSAELPDASFAENDRRNLRKADDMTISLEKLELKKEKHFLAQEEAKSEELRQKYVHRHQKHMKLVTEDPGVHRRKEHGIMIDAGSSGSRLHLYEWEPRVLSNSQDVEDAVSGKKITFPYARSRWTDRLRPGIDSFASLEDQQLLEALKEYLSPLLDFAKTVLHKKQDDFDKFPIFLRATAGMRILEKNDRARVLGAIRALFNDKAYCPFRFEDEYARVLSGEEEAIFGWAGINFAMGTLVEESEGVGTVVNPKLTYGAMDLGGASTQIAFYEPQEDIMANLFKLQIGQSKHWNIYAHSFLYFGMNEARKRFQAKLASKEDANTRLVVGVHNPCLPGGSRKEVRLNIHFDEFGQETFDYDAGVSQNGFYQAVLKNDNNAADFDECIALTNNILKIDANSWCKFAHQGECAFNGVAMPDLPAQSDSFGEFLAFSNYYHVWEFLDLPQRASIQELYDATRNICSMSKDQLFEFNSKHGKVHEEDVEDYCFRSAYAFNLLRNGYGFSMDEYITATDVVGGLKVGWSLGAMLYEINTFPWTIDESESNFNCQIGSHVGTAVVLFLAAAVASIICFRIKKSRRERALYEPLKNANDVQPNYTGTTICPVK
eukprot:scaffold2149_cov187-Cylindrotheca_fusiformis.AAC.30